MKKNNNLPEIGLPAEACSQCGFTDKDTLELHAGDGALVIMRNKMTVPEVAAVIDTLSAIASDLTVCLAKACGVCDNCGNEKVQPCAECNGGEVCAKLNGCKDTPADWVADCISENGLLEGSGVTVPEYLLEEAGIPTDARLDAYADEDSGEITIVEADIQHDISDLSPGIIAVLAASGVCLMELDELIMLEEIVYGK